jgi:DmsE family decaheme c-type cytochrome
MIIKLMMTAALVLCASLPAVADYGYPVLLDAIPGANYEGSEACLDCHDEIGESYAHSPHAVDFAYPVPGTSVTACEACHGPGSLHIENDGDGHILGLEFMAGLDTYGRNAMCLQCHTDKQAHWADSAHADTEIGCADCHADQNHFGGQTRAYADYRNPSEFCLQCHEAQIAEFRLPSRHRVLESEVGCADCHSPHGDAAADLVFDDLNAACLRCHTEMAGPFIFEHEGVTPEDCTACHRPHGSINDKLLTQDSNSLCLQCHYEPGLPQLGDFPHAANPGACTDCHTDGIPTGTNPHVALTGQIRCYDCHFDIHGSNTSPVFQD